MCRPGDNMDNLFEQQIELDKTLKQAVAIDVNAFPDTTKKHPFGLNFKITKTSEKRSLWQKILQAFITTVFILIVIPLRRFLE